MKGKTAHVIKAGGIGHHWDTGNYGTGWIIFIFYSIENCYSRIK